MHEKLFDPCPIHQYWPTHFCCLSQISQHLPEVCYFSSSKKKKGYEYLLFSWRPDFFYFSCILRFRQNIAKITKIIPAKLICFHRYVCFSFLRYVFFFNIRFWKGLLFALFVLFDVSCRLNIDLVSNI